MSDSYIPELIELSSFWQNAVDEAIEETLKGEKKLHYALKNREKIKDKLQKLGVKANGFGETSVEGKPYSCHKNRYSIGQLENNSQHSFASAEEGFLSHVYGDREKSQTGSKTRDETPYQYQHSDRPLFGDASLEKITKSQNDFNFEAMGRCEGAKMFSSVSESEGEDYTCDNGAAGSGHGRASKKVEWLHRRENGNFEDSDSGVSESSKKHLCSNSDANSYLRRNVREEEQKIPLNFDPKGDIFWENEVKNAIRTNAHFERKLQFALAKRDILNEYQSILQIEPNEIGIGETEAKSVEKRQRGMKFLSPFVRFYLDVYREMCLKNPTKEISEEAAKRWWNKTIKTKSEQLSKKSKK